MRSGMHCGYKDTKDVQNLNYNPFRQSQRARIDRTHRSARTCLVRRSHTQADFPCDHVVVTQNDGATRIESGASLVVLYDRRIELFV
jgi:hypothetical protein